ncbi:MAG: alpha/beta fold hydrolase [Gemmatimonadota bacterium]
MSLSPLLALGFAVSALATHDTVKVERQAVRFSNANIELAATLLRPVLPGRHPALVVIHGSGNSDRSNPWTTAYADALASRGIVVLYPDKRGSGESGGSWKTSSFQELATDASAGIALLRKRTDVDTARIGVIAFSQGGYVAAVVAAQDSSCKLVAVVSGGVATLLDQTVDELVIEAELAKAPLAIPDELILRRVYRQAFAAAQSGEGWGALSDSIAHAGSRSAPLASALRSLPTDSTHWAYKWIRSTGDFDPVGFWKQVRRPVVFFYGGRDTQIRTRRSIERFWEVVGSDTPNFAFGFLQGNGHALFRDDVLGFLVGWLHDAGAN